MVVEANERCALALGYVMHHLVQDKLESCMSFWLDLAYQKGGFQQVELSHLQALRVWAAMVFDVENAGKELMRSIMA